MLFVAGIDQSVRHTGVCVLDADGNIADLRLIEPSKTLEGSKHLVFIRDSLNELLKKYALKVVVMEGYSYNSLNKKFLLGEVGATIKLCVYDTNATLYDAAPTQLKKFVTGRGDASKEDVMTHLASQYGVHITDDNLADAYGLARIALQINQKTSEKRHQLEVVKQITYKSLSVKKPHSKVRTPRFTL